MIMSGRRKEQRWKRVQEQRKLQRLLEDSGTRVQLHLAGAWRGVGGRQELMRAEAQGADGGRW